MELCPSTSWGQHASKVGLAPKRERSGFENESALSTCPTFGHGLHSVFSLYGHPSPTTGLGEENDVYWASDLDGLMILALCTHPVRDGSRCTVSSWYPSYYCDFI